MATYRRLTKELLLFRLHGLQEGGGFAVSNAEHKAIVGAIATRDPEQAGRVLREHGELAFRAGNDDRIDVAREHELFGRDEFKVESGHGDAPESGALKSSHTRPSSDDARRTEGDPAAPRAAGLWHQAEAASFWAFSTASSMVPTM